MTMLDERLRESLKDAADEFPVPHARIEEILRAPDRPATTWGERLKAVTRAIGLPREPGNRRRLSGRAPKIGLAALGAVAVLVVTVVLTTSGGAPVRPALALHGASPSTGSAVGAPRSAVTSTTVALPAPALSAASGASSEQSAAPPSAGLAPSTPAASVPPGVGQTPEVERNGSANLTLKGTSVAAVVDKLTALASYEGGFVASSQIQEGSGAHATSTGEITLQVPTNSFTSVIGQLPSYGRVSMLVTKATDVTGQYVDLQARITALEDSRQQYLTILSKASSIGDILSVQAQLDTIQSELEQLQGQLQVMNSQTTYASLAVSLSEGGPKPPPPPTQPSSIDRAWHHAISDFTGAIDDLVRDSGALLFVLLCLGALVILGRLGWRRMSRRIL